MIEWRHLYCASKLRHVSGEGARACGWAAPDLPGLSFPYRLSSLYFGAFLFHALSFCPTFSSVVHSLCF